MTSPAGKAGRISVLIIQPAEQPLLLRPVPAGGNQLQEFPAQVRGIQTQPAVDVKSAKAHLPELVYLPKQGLPLRLSAPCPKGRSAIFGRRMTEKRLIQYRRLSFGV